MGWKHNGKIEAPMWDHYMCKKSFWVKSQEFLGEKSVQEEYLGEESLGEKM